METFTAASHHDVLVLIIQVATLLFTARLLGELMQRFGQPSVVGEILAGVLLGPSCLSGLFPLIEEWIVPQTPVQGYLLEVIGLLGVMFLLLITGLETDLVLIRRQARSALGVALGGLLLPLAVGFALGMLLPEDLLADPDQRLVFALFLATAMSISAIPVLAKVLMDLNLTRRDVGQVIIAAAMLDDTVGWTLLSIVGGLAGGEAVNPGSVGASVGKVLLFMGVSFTVGLWLVKRLLFVVQDRVKSRDKFLSLVVMLTFAWGAISQALNLEAMLGAFVLGILFSQMPSFDSAAVHELESMALGIFAPIFFAIAGLKVNVLNLLKPELMFISLVVIALATFCKVVGVYGGARLIGGKDHWTALFYGMGLNARGSMGIILATVGLSLGIVTQNMFSIIVVMAVFTSFIAPAGMRWVFPRIQVDPQELERLRREELNKDNFVANVHRALLPIRFRAEAAESPTQMIEAYVLRKINPNLALTLMTVIRSGQESASQEFLSQRGQVFAQKEQTRRVMVSDNTAHAILDELSKDYDLLLLGATEKRPDASTLFNPVIDTLVRLSPCPAIVVKAVAAVDADWQPQRILVPTSGSTNGRAAAQVAFALAADTEAKVSLLKVVQQDRMATDLYESSDMAQHEMGIAYQIVDDVVKMGAALGVSAFGRVEVGAEPEQIILNVARAQGSDLIVLGASVRPGSDRLYLGAKVERILDHAPCPVLVVNAE